MDDGRGTTLLGLILEGEQALPGFCEQRLELYVALLEGLVVGDEGVENGGDLVVVHEAGVLRGTVAEVCKAGAGLAQDLV